MDLEPILTHAYLVEKAVTQPCRFAYTETMDFFSCNRGKVEQEQQRMYGSPNLKYLLPGPVLKHSHLLEGKQYPSH